MSKAQTVAEVQLVPWGGKRPFEALAGPDSLPFIRSVCAPAETGTTDLFMRVSEQSRCYLWAQNLDRVTVVGKWTLVSSLLGALAREVQQLGSTQPPG